jgi:HEAT repeat protein
MAAPSSIVAALARMLELLATAPDDRDAQKAAFRTLFAMLEGAGAQISADLAGLTVDGTQLAKGSPGAADVQARLILHGIGVLGVPAGVKAADLLAVLRRLADPAVSPAGAEGFVQNLPREAALAIHVGPPRGLPPAGDTIILEETGLVSVKNPAAPGPPAPMPYLPLTESSGGSAGSLSPEAEPPNAFPHDELRELEARADLAYRHDDWEEVLTVASRVLAAEAAAGGDAHQRRFAITWRRILPKPALQHIARLALAGQRRPEALAALERMGDDAVEPLLELMTVAPTLEERRNYFSVLSRMKAGGPQIIGRLDHPDWFVVRNVAELCGELKLEDAVPRLADQVSHRDERVRRAVTGALARIGTTAALEPLRRALRDPAPAVRLQAAHALGAPWTKGIAMTAVLRLDEEEHPDVLRELHLALGRFGTAEAVLALRKSAAPAKGLFARKPTALRLAAIDGLALVQDAAARNALVELLGDSDQAVRDAVGRILK